MCICLVLLTRKNANKQNSSAFNNFVIFERERERFENVFFQMLNFKIFLFRLAFYVVWRTGSASVAKTPKESNSRLQITSNAPTATAETNATNGPRVRYIMLFKIKTLWHIITHTWTKIYHFLLCGHDWMRNRYFMAHQNDVCKANSEIDP